MKKMRIFVAIVVAMIFATSCGTVSKIGEGRGYSQNEQTSIDKSFVAAVADASFHDKSNVEASIKQDTKDMNGKPVELTQITKSVKTDGVYTNIETTSTTIKKDGGFVTVTKAKGKREE